MLTCMYTPRGVSSSCPRCAAPFRRGRLSFLQNAAELFNVRTISPECGAAGTLENSDPAFWAAQVSKVPPEISRLRRQSFRVRSGFLQSAHFAEMGVASFGKALISSKWSPHGCFRQGTLKSAHGWSSYVNEDLSFYVNAVIPFHIGSAIPSVQPSAQGTCSVSLSRSCSVLPFPPPKVWNTSRVSK